MNYTVQIYNYDFTSHLTSLFYGADIYDLKYVSEVNKAGGLSFSINVRNSKALAPNFQVYNKIIVEKDGVGVFIGYIDSLEASVNVVEVACVGLLGLFKKRLYSGGFSGGSSTVQSAFFSILASVNAQQDTGITQGISGISQSLTSISFNRSMVSTAWEQLASLADGEFQITPELKLDFVDRLGEDKSATVALRYDIQQLPSANLRNFSVDVEGKNLYNRIVGVRNGGSTATEEDTVSKEQFGLLEVSKNASQIASAVDLVNDIKSFILNHKGEFYVPSVVVDERKIDTSVLSLGDTVMVQLNNGFIAISMKQRIIKKSVSVSDNAVETIKLDLVPETGNLLPSSFFTDMIELTKRVEMLESDI